MRGRAFLAVVLIAIAIRCVPGRVGILNVGGLIPPMPLKNTPETLDAAPRPTFTPTPSPTPVPSPIPIATPAPGVPEPLPTP